MRLLTDSCGKRIVEKKTRQRLTKIPKNFSEFRPFWQLQDSSPSKT